MNRQSMIRFSRQSYLFCAAFIAVLTLAVDWRVSGQSAGSTGNQELPTLELNQSVQRELAAGQRHSYQINLVNLEAGQSVKIEVEQQGIDVVVQLFSPDKMNTPQVDAEPWAHGKEVILWEAAVAGTYRVEVHAWRSITPAGRYVIRWTKVDEMAQQERTLAKASRLCAQAINYLQNGKNDEGLKLAEESLALRENLLQPNDPAIAESLYWLISLLEVGGGFDDQERIDQLYGRRLQLLERAFGPDHPHVARWLNDLANRTELVRAVELFQRGLTILEKSYGPDHPDVGLLLSNYAIKLDAKGDYERAEAMYKRSADIREKSVGQDDILAQSFNNLGDFYLVRDDYEHAETYLQRALAIWTKVHGRQHYRTTFAIGNLGDLYRQKGDFVRAEPLAKETLEILQKVTAPNSQEVGGAHHGLGLLYLRMGDYLRAEQSLQKSQAILERFSNQVNNIFTVLLRTRVRLALAMGKNDEAIAIQRRVAEISESALNKVLAFGSEQDKLNFLKAFADETNAALSLHARFAPNDARALELAFTTWLQRKGRALDEMNRSIGLLRRAAGNDAAPLFDRLMAKQSQLSRLATAEPEEQSRDETAAKIKQATEEVEQIQSTISARSAEFRAQTLPVTLNEVRAALPPNAVLVEFARYEPEDARTKKKAAPRYLAYVLPKEGELQWVELGAVAQIDAAVQVFRKTLIKQQGTASHRPAARALDKLVMQPVRPLLGKARHIFVAPEGSLNLVPFATLRDERGRYLVEDYLFSYLTSGRDLLRLQVKHQNQPEELILAVSNFDEKAGSVQAGLTEAQGFSDHRGNRLSDNPTMATLRFRRLQFALAEARAVQSVEPSARIYSDAQATETFLKQVHRPRFLHIVTHGFFLPEGGAKLENPLLRSGIALAGANQRSSGRDDGILTALEAAALDLWGTKLVVLSACGTGLGQVKNGEGVFGLRRALVLAGAETQLATLWDIDDEVTGDLMKNYYQRLQRGAGRAEALRQVQLELLRGKAHRHPRFWASFVMIGEWANLKGER